MTIHAYRCPNCRRWFQSKLHPLRMLCELCGYHGIVSGEMVSAVGPLPMEQKLYLCQTCPETPHLHPLPFKIEKPVKQKPTEDYHASE